MISKAKESAEINSALYYIDAVEKYMILHDLNSEKYPYKLEQGKTYYVVEDSSFAYDNNFSLIGKIYAEEETTNIYLSDFIEVKGEAPIDGYVVIGEKNTVAKSVFGVKNHEITCEKNSCKATGNFSSDIIRVSSVVIDEVESNKITAGKSLQLSVTVLPNNATNKNVTWTSSDENIAIVDEKGLVTGISEGVVTITARSNNNKKCEIQIEVMNDSILGYIKETTFENDSITSIEANGKTYSAHVYNFDGDQVWDTNQTFGTASDIGTASTDAQNMVVVKVNGDLTINEGVTVKPYYTEYGGPKGFLLYVTGTLTNNGTIDNSHGAKAIGEDVYLWQNENGEYEYVPATGGVGAEKNAPAGTTASNVITSVGKPGGAGIEVALRATGGGASGGLIRGYYSGPGVSTAEGSSGTSYSGGTGSGGMTYQYKNTSYVISTYPGEVNGGAGGAARDYRDGNWTVISYGGIGNPNGYDIWGSSSGLYPGKSYYKSRTSGTGGLLIIYASIFDNHSTISTNGVDNICTSYGSWSAGGGASGGGSINVFYDNLISLGTLEANGGKASGCTYNGGNGGAGTVTTGSILSGSFIKD